MISLIRKFLLDNWLRKVISFALALIIWFVVDQSLTSSKSINAVGIRVINLPQGKTIHGLQTSGLLNKRIDINVTGKKAYIEELNNSDIEVILDVSHFANEGIISLDKKNLVSLNPKISIHRHISRIASKNLVIDLVPLAQEKIPIYITKPIGEAPKGYQYIDIWPYHLNLTVSGPEETIKKLKSQGLKLTYNLSDISRSDLDREGLDKNKNVTSFFIPDNWKMVNLPSLSDIPIQIDDPDANLLRIDFIRSTIIPLKCSIPVSLFFSPGHLPSTSPSSISIGTSETISSVKGVKILNTEIYTKGVSELFLDIVKDMISIVFILSSTSIEDDLDWSIQFINPKICEDLYVTRVITEVKDEELMNLNPRVREEYLRNRFRNYMNRFQLCDSDGNPLQLYGSLKGREVSISQHNLKKNN
jgi:hypothetical protein